MKKLLKIKIKLIVTLSIVLVLAFISTNLASYLVSKYSFRTTSLDEILPLINNNIFSEIQRDIMRPIHVSSLMANDTFLKDWAIFGEKNLPQIVKYLNEIRARYGFFTSFFVSDRTKNYYYYKGILKKIRRKDKHDVWYYKFKDSKAPFDLDVDTDQAHQNSLTVFINHRLTDYEGNFLGVTGVGLNMDQVGHILSSYQKKYHRSVYMVDGSGLVQMHSNKKYVVKTTLGNLLGDQRLAKVILANKSQSATYELDRGGRHLLLACRYFKQFGWFLIVEQDESASLGDIRQALFTNLSLGFLVTAFIVAVVVVVVNRFQKSLELMASMDDLTQIPNRRYFMDNFQRELAQSERYGRRFSLLMIDADHFKKINDRLGHEAGDEALKHLAKLLKDGLREGDILGRLGGEEFAALLPETGPHEAETAAQRIRQAVEASSLSLGEEEVKLTVTIGVASADNGKPGAKELLRQADKAMYQAKELGRNRVAMFQG